MPGLRTGMRQSGSTLFLLRIEQAGLTARRRGEAEMLPAAAVEAAPSCRPGDEAKLNEIGFDDLFQRVAGFAQSRCKRLDPDRSPAIEVRDHGQVAPVHRVEAEPIDFQPGQGPVGDCGVDRIRAGGMGKVADAAKQPARDARRAAASAGDLVLAFASGWGAEQSGSPADDLFKFVDRVEVEPDRNTEAI